MTIKIETNRLLITPLTGEQLALYLQGDNRFEEEFNLVDCGRKPSAEIRDRVAKTILQVINDPLECEDYLFYTFWIVVDKSAKMIVAELGFKGSPNENGEIEIGYGTMAEHRGKGYMREAVGAMINWAGQQLGVRYILAETDEHNLASISVLQKNNFHCFEIRGKMIWWKIAVK
jgi:ribosomal-protein-alanine N-acetyltransferase